MRALLFTAVSTLILTVQAQAEELIHSVEINKIDSVEFMNFQPMGWASDCTKLSTLRPAVGLSDVLDLADIVNLGEQVWKVVKENEPILEAKGMTASALPMGIQCWNQLSNWSPTRSDTYEVVYKNLYGMKVVDVKFRVIYTYGGKLKGKGNYLTNATIRFGKVNVLWGYMFNADVEIPQVVNMGSVDNPLAGMELTLNWTVNTRPISLKKSLNSMSFFIAGDGRATRVLD